jgi:hypothetical protein
LTVRDKVGDGQRQTGEGQDPPLNNRKIDHLHPRPEKTLTLTRGLKKAGLPAPLAPPSDDLNPVRRQAVRRGNNLRPIRVVKIEAAQRAPQRGFPRRRSHAGRPK